MISWAAFGEVCLPPSGALQMLGARDAANGKHSLQDGRIMAAGV